MNYLLSCNVVALQLKYGGKLYPETPLVGYGGAPYMASQGNYSN